MATKKRTTYKVSVKVWLYPGAQGAWHFVTVPKKESVLIRRNFGAHARGFGSLPVLATIGETVWKTSIFPDSREGAYMLPVKADVRRREDVVAGDVLVLKIEIVR